MGIVHIQAELVEDSGLQMYGVRAVAAAHSLAVPASISLIIIFRAVAVLFAHICGGISWLKEVIPGIGSKPVPVLGYLLGGRWVDGCPG